ncbi:MAG: hypothetical protein ACLQUY_07470 [Ktedonobacterales bacterium]
MLTHALHHVTPSLQSHHGFGCSIVNVALPTIQRELGFAAASLRWGVTGHALTIELLLVLAGPTGTSIRFARLVLVD